MQRNDPLLGLVPIENHLRVPWREQSQSKSSRPFRRNISTSKASVQAGVEQKEKDPQNIGATKSRIRFRKCRALMAKSYPKKMKILKQNGVCFNCVASGSHFARDGTNPHKCTKWEGNDHVTPFHASQ